MPRVLLIEDDEDDRELIARLLDGAWELQPARSLDDATWLLAHRPADVVLLDLGLPDAAGTAGVERLVHGHPDLPVVVLTGLDHDATGLRAIQAGAQDYLVKGQADRRLLDRSLRYAIERKRAERALARLAAIMTGMCDECGRKLGPEPARSQGN